MASVKFEKGSQEFMMFVDFWNLCQKFWIIEKTSDGYWESFIKESGDFADKYNDIPLARRMAIALAEDLEVRSKSST